VISSPPLIAAGTGKPRVGAGLGGAPTVAHEEPCTERTPETAPRSAPTRDIGEQTRKMVVQRVGHTRTIVVPTLRVVAGRDLLRFVTLQPGEQLVVGRDDSAALLLTDASVSRRHAVVQCRDDGTVLFRDLGSTNGTAQHGVPMLSGTLNAGDTVEFGTVVVRLDLLSLEEVAHLETVASRLEATNRDPLTGLLTRAYLDEELPELLTRAEAGGVPMSLIFADVDHFKRVNDTWGHTTGDDVLVIVGRLLMLGVRDTDACVRYGGEELMIILHGASADAAAEVAERARATVADHDWERTAQQLAVTASFGVTAWVPGESIKDWISRADRALYAAKAHGRNRVCIS
jgi:diguanylate cyclase (GGDEF)-like protein